MKSLSTCLLLVVTLSLLLSCKTKVSSGQELSSTDQSKPSKILSFASDVRCIFHDSKGNYWVGSHREGVAVYDGDTIRYFTVADGLADNQVRTIQEDSNGIIWFGTARGVSSYDGNILTNHTQDIDLDMEVAWSAKREDLWFNAGNNQGVFRHDGQSVEYLSFPEKETYDAYNLHAVTGHAKGKNNMQWISTFAGVFGYDGDQFTIIDNKTLGLDGDNGLLHVRSIYEDSKGRLWVGNNGIGVLLKEGDEIINFSEKMGLIHPESKRAGDKSPAGTLEHVFAIGEDKDGNIWFGDRDNGAWKYDGSSMTNYPIRKDVVSVSDHPFPAMIWSIYNDQDNNLLFANTNRVYRFNGKSFDKWL